MSKDKKPKRRNMLQEIFGMLKARKSYWLIPIVVVLLVLIVIIVLGSTSAAPFIYTLF